jgi:hypothetical protein
MLRFLILLGLKPGHACDAISVVAEFMVDIAGVEARPFVCDPSARLSDVPFACDRTKNKQRGGCCGGCGGCSVHGGLAGCHGCWVLAPQRGWLHAATPTLRLHHQANRCYLISSHTPSKVPGHARGLLPLEADGALSLIRWEPVWLSRGVMGVCDVTSVVTEFMVASLERSDGGV